MKKLLLIPMFALSVSGCMTPGSISLPGVVQQASCEVDERIETAWKAFDLALDAINVLGDVGKIVPGTPQGKAVAAGIRKTNAAMGRAERFAATCSEGQANSALNDAEAAMADISTALKGD